MHWLFSTSLERGGVILVIKVARVEERPSSVALEVADKARLELGLTTIFARV